VATEGQTVEIVDKVLYVDGEVAAIPEMSKHIDPKIYPSALSQRDNFGPLMVSRGAVFLLGDNRDDSQDSRYWGPIDTENLKGKAVFIYFSYEPDPNAPDWEFPYIFSFFEIGFHNLFHFFERARLWRLGSVY
jgi:signal peptidase I